jgi:hypothetical protein
MREDNQMGVYAYADQNFLIYAEANPAWRDAVTKAHRSGAVSIVLSPWHFYEYGNARAHPDTEKLITFAEELGPKWTMTRADLQLFEFWATWDQIWQGIKEAIDPVSSLQDVAAILSKVHYGRIEGETIRAFVQAFSADGALDEAQVAMDEQTGVTSANLKSYIEGRFDKDVRRRMELNHLAIQRARLELGKDDPALVESHVRAMWSKQPLATQLECFVDWGCVGYLKSYLTECAFSEDLYSTKGQLDRNRFVDREHASIALPYCRYFVTSDKKLANSCNRVKGKLSFTTEEVVNGEDFIAMLLKEVA